MPDQSISAVSRNVDRFITESDALEMLRHRGFASHLFFFIVVRKGKYVPSLLESLGFGSVRYTSSVSNARHLSAVALP